MCPVSKTSKKTCYKPQLLLNLLSEILLWLELVVLLKWARKCNSCLGSSVLTCGSSIVRPSLIGIDGPVVDCCWRKSGQSNELRPYHYGKAMDAMVNKPLIRPYLLGGEGWLAMIKPICNMRESPDRELVNPGVIWIYGTIKSGNTKQTSNPQEKKQLIIYGIESNNTYIQWTYKQKQEKHHTAKHKTIPTNTHIKSGSSQVNILASARTCWRKSLRAKTFTAGSHEVMRLVDTVTILTIYIYMYIHIPKNPKMTLVLLVLIGKGFVLGVLTVKNTGHLGSRYKYIYIIIYVYVLMGDYVDYPFMKISHKFPSVSSFNHQNQCRFLSINCMVAPCWPNDSLQPLLVFHRNPSSLSMTHVTKICKYYIHLCMYL